MDHFKSFVDEFFQGFLPGFYNKNPGRSPDKDLYYEIILTRQEAEKGGLFPISISVNEPCSVCSGTHTISRLFCPRCSGYGYIQSQREFSLSIPPNIKHGTKQTISLEDIGLKNTYLHIVVHVSFYD